MQDSSIASSEKSIPEKEILLGKEYSSNGDHSEDDCLDEEVAGSFRSLKFGGNSSKRKREAESSDKSPDDGSEDERKSTATEDDDRSSTSSDDEGIGLRASALLKSWSTLKVISGEKC